MLERFRDIENSVPDFLIVLHRKRDVFCRRQPQPVLAQIQLDNINESLPDVFLRVLSVMLRVGKRHEMDQSVAAVKDPDMWILRHICLPFAKNRLLVKHIICASLCTSELVYTIIISQRIELIHFRFFSE